MNPVSETYNMDCMEYMKNIPDKWFDLAICDPPYGINQGGHKNHTRGTKRNPAKAYKPFDDKNSPDKKYFDELFRISKNQIIFGANHFISKIPLDSSCWIVWDKDNGNNDFADCELAWTSFTNKAVRKFKYRWNGMFQEKMKHKEIRIHPTQKPIHLYSFLLTKYAKQGYRIFDSHLGSGSSRIAAYKLGYDFYATEIDNDYFAAQEERFHKECFGEIKLTNNVIVKQTYLFDEL